MICAAGGCEDPTVGKSKYCRPHRAESRALWKERIAADAAERTTRAARYSALWDRAMTAGRAAAESVVPVPMVIQGYAPITEGVCGFAWINVNPGGSRFANWLKRQGLARKAYRGGVDVWISDYGQSMTRKEAFARAAADVLRDALAGEGVTVYPGSRMD